ncbi:uncharacterized protein LOC143029973 [Oratosquilla oratoria]|uniref:uncharacterized protein LOC143029973 n=1 Tax=Oratosquilla oratoria TaxID=337810 RepID=UPI003F7780CA
MKKSEKIEENRVPTSIMTVAQRSSTLRMSFKQKLPLVLRVAVGVVLVLFLGGAYMMTSTSTPYSVIFLERLKGPLKADDPELIEYIKSEILLPPSELPYSLNAGDMSVVVKEETESFYRAKLTKLFLGKERLFFVEAGALDGESMSNTLWLERFQKWSGLLVEPDSLSFAALKSKNRKAWSANVCLSPGSFPSQEFMATQSHRDANPGEITLGFKSRAMHGLATFVPYQDFQSSWFTSVQCLPLQSLLLALQVSKVDLLSLDVEGGEMAIIENFDLDKFNVQVLCLEWKKAWQMLGIIDRMKKLGYLVYASMPEDLILVRKGSPYEQLINKTEAEMVHNQWRPKLRQKTKKKKDGSL